MAIRQRSLLIDRGIVLFLPVTKIIWGVFLEFQVNEK